METIAKSEYEKQRLKAIYYEAKYKALLKQYQGQLVKSVVYQDEIHFLQWRMGIIEGTPDRYLV